MTPAQRLAAAKRSYDLAVAAHRQNELAEAAQHYRDVHGLFPEHPGALHGLGLIATREHQYPDAVDYLRQASKAAPASEPIRCDLGQALLLLGRYQEALNCFRAVLRAQPENVAALSGAGNALNILGRTKEALTAFRKLRTLAPQNAEAYFGMASAHLQTGNTSAARTELEHAITLAPTRATYHRALAELERFMENDPRLGALEALVREEDDVPDDQKVELHFALAKACDDLQRCDDSFAHLKKGNAIRRGMVSYDERAVADIFQRMKDVFSAGVLGDAKGDPSSTPIFIVGMPRSGTTLIEQILSSDLSVQGLGELTYIQDLIVEGFAGSNYPDSAAALTEEARAKFGAAYLEQLGTFPRDVERVVDKFPGNFQHIGLIHLALPNARIIHMRRDPMDTCFSCYSKLFLNGLNYAYDLGELGRYYRLYDSLMAHWRRVLPEGAMLDVQYETLVRDFESEARRIVEYCGLTWNERFLSFHENDRAVRTASQMQVRQPLFANAIGRWKNYESHLTTLRDALDQPA
jgi:tetratricopeptide (TPR) repeat protein